MSELKCLEGIPRIGRLTCLDYLECILSEDVSRYVFDVFLRAGVARLGVVDDHSRMPDFFSVPSLSSSLLFHRDFVKRLSLPSSSVGFTFFQLLPAEDVLDSFVLSHIDTVICVVSTPFAEWWLLDFSPVLLLPQFF